jgi:hypothetical protein
VAKTELLRVVAVSGQLVPDLRSRLPGRGAYVHPESGCLNLAERRKAFQRALRVAGPLDLSALRGHIEERGSVEPDADPSRRDGMSRSSTASRKQVEMRMSAR